MHVNESETRVSVTYPTRVIPRVRIYELDLGPTGWTLGPCGLGSRKVDPKGGSMSRRLNGGNTAFRRRTLSDPFSEGSNVLTYISFTGKLPEFLKSLKCKKIVLIHGESFGAWCWYKTIALLEEVVLHPTSLDIKGSGINTTDSNHATTLAEFSQPLIDYLQNLEGYEKSLTSQNSNNTRDRIVGNLLSDFMRPEEWKHLENRREVPVVSSLALKSWKMSKGLVLPLLLHNDSPVTAEWIDRVNQPLCRRSTIAGPFGLGTPRVHRNASEINHRSSERKSVEKFNRITIARIRSVLEEFSLLVVADVVDGGGDLPVERTTDVEEDENNKHC
ncbi:hypothetical protein SAY87_000872 [Trapa incisa]|uniref:AB hydrolase-1 domain-containing protein n=1 Tax=Trapa incisa TaxID=236973 RepID=A0AAN7GCP8_9MYRT|nr:hypothetical protein SAY87_000872 [Trapa incisa]